jgi:hypothetical protein
METALSLLEGAFGIDLGCDDVVPFNERLGMTRWTAMIRRDPGAPSP